MALTLGLSAASTAVGYIGQQQQAKQQREYNNAVYEQQKAQALAQAEYQNRQVERNNQYMQQNAVNAVEAADADKDALVVQQRQQGIATALELQQTRVEKLRAKGAIQASERAGLTLETLLADFDRQEATAKGIQQQNLAFASGQRMRERATIDATLESRINQARPYESAPIQTPYAPAPVQGPSLLAAGIGFASQAASTINSRSVYDASAGRYRIDGVSRIPTSLPQPRATLPQAPAPINNDLYSPRGLN